MAKQLSNVYIGSDTFATWIEKTNLGLYTISTVAVTTAANTTGAVTTGNAVVNGVLSAETLVAPTALRGGSVTTPGTLTITSAVDVQNTFINVISTNANVTIGGSGKFANIAVPVEFRANVHIVTGTANLFIAATNATFNTTALDVTSDFAIRSTSNTSNKLFNAVSSTNVVSFSANTLTAAVTSNYAVTSGNAAIVAANTTIGNSTVFGVRVTNDGTTTAVTIGGNTASISSNLTLSGANVDIRNVTFNSANTTLSGSGILSITTTTANVVSNVAFVGSNVTMGSTTTTNLNGNVFITSDLQYVVTSNTNIGANTTAAQNVYTFAKASYSTAEVVATAKTPGGNTQIVKLLVAHDGTTAISTAYGTIASPAGANVGVFSTELVGANVNVKFLQSSPNTSLKVVAQLIK